MQKIINDIDPMAGQTKTDFDQLAAQMANVNQGITKLETRMQGVEEMQDKTMADKEDLTNLITDTQNSQRQMGGAIKTLSERIAVLLSYTVKNSDFIENILHFLSNIGKTSKSPNQFVQCFHKWINVLDSDADGFGE